MGGASTRPRTRSIHGAPHVLGTEVSNVTHAHVAALQYLWTSDAGIPVSTASHIVGYVGCLLERHQLDLRCSWPAHLRVLAPAASMGHLTR